MVCGYVCLLIVVYEQPAREGAVLGDELRARLFCFVGWLFAVCCVCEAGVAEQQIAFPFVMLLQGEESEASGLR